MKTHLFLIIAFVLLSGFISAQDNKASVALAAAIYEEEVSGNLDRAVALYLDILKKHPDDRTVAAKTLYHLGLVNEKMGKQKAYEYFTQLINTYPDQTEIVAMAKAKLTANSNRPAESNSETTMHRIWNAGKDIPLDISPDGRYAIFNKFESGDLWLHDLQTGEQKQITTDASWVQWTYAYGGAAISPDGKKIAYPWWVRSNGEFRLSALDGSSMHVISNGMDGRRLYACTWMPDGQQILASSFDRNDNTYRRHIISLPDYVIHNIGSPEMEELNWGYPSPDGHYIVYGLKNDIFIYDLTNGQDSCLIQTSSNDNIVDWIPDGSGILFVSDRSGSRDLYLLRMKKGKPVGEPELLRRNLGSSGNLRLSKDGRLFQIENIGTGDSFIIQIDEQSGKPNGTASLVEPNFPGAAFSRWSQDGKLLYYEVFKNEPSNEYLLFIRPEETGQAKEIKLKTKLNYWYNPVLSPDGHLFAVTGTGENMNFGIFTIDPKSGDVTQIAKIPTENEVTDPAQNWSPDSKAIYYKVRSPEKSEEYIIRRKDVVTGEEKDVYRGFCTREMKISPDGNRFVYFRNDGPTKSHVLALLDLQSGKELELCRVPETDAPEISGPVWSHDGGYIFVIKGMKQCTELWRFPVDGGKGEKLHSFKDYTGGISIHPSGNRMAFTQNRINYELWVIENLLPK